MTRILVTADWHVGDYLDRGSTTERTEQFRRLPSRLIEIAKQKDTHLLAILGDFKRSPNQRAELDNLLSDMVDECADYFDIIYIVFGQHDSDSKTEVSEKYSNVYRLLRHKNVIYANKQHFKIDWADVYFQDYQYKKEVEVDPCDLFLTHFTVGMGQTVDNTKFRVCLCGDIHKQTQIGNIISVGVPFQHDMNCDHEGHVRLVTLTDEHKIHIDNISIISESFNPLVFAYDDEVLDRKFTNVLRIPRPTKMMSTAGGLESNESNELFNLDKYITESMPEEFKSDWANLQELTKDVDFNQISLDFKILKVGAHNYWSIGDVEFDFSNDKLINLIGANGSGKTTVTRIINSLFEPKALLKNYMNQNENTSDGTCSVWGEILYKGDVYRIKRSLDKTEFWINGEQQTRTNVTQLEGYITQCLPFIQFNHFFRLKIGSEFFNNQARLPLVQKAFNFDQIDKYFKKAKELFDNKNIEFRDIQKQLVGQTAILQDKVKEYDTICPTHVLPEVNEEDKSRKIAYDNLKNSWTEKNAIVKTLETLIQNKPEVPTVSEVECDSKIEECKLQYERQSEDLADDNEKLSSIKAKITELQNLKTSSVCPTCGRPLAEIPQDTDTKISQLQEEQKTWERICADTRETLLNYRNDLEKYQNIKSLFPARKQYQENLDKYTNASSALKEVEDNPLFSLGDEINQKYEEYRKNHQLRETIIGLQTKISEYEGMCSNLQNQANILKVEVERLARFMKLFVYNDKQSLISDLITKICIAISDEKVKFVYANNSIGAWLRVNDEWVCYDRTSGGQRVVVDLLVMQKFSKLLGNVGYVVLDEFLAPCDANHFIECTHALNDFNFNQLFYISQQDTFNIDCKRILCELDPQTNTTVFTETI